MPASNTEIREQQGESLATDLQIPGGSKEGNLHFSTIATSAKSKHMGKICFVSAAFILLAAATLAALYAPNHMPDAVGKIVEGLSTTAFYGITAGAGVAGVAGIAGLGMAFYSKPKIKDLEILGLEVIYDDAGPSAS